MEPLPDIVGGGAYHSDGRLGTIRLDPRLDQRTRNAVLAHELHHHQRGGGCDDPAADWIECQRIWRLVDEDLVPDDELRVWWVQAEATGEHVLPHQVADAFHVPEDVAERAMRRLLDRIRGGIR